MPSKQNVRTSNLRDGIGSQNVRDHIIDCAEALLAEAGYGALTISAVCKRAHVSPPSLYWHFGSKEGLLAAMLKAALRRDASRYLSLDVGGLLLHQALDQYLAALRDIIVSSRPNCWVMLSALSEARHAAPEVAEIIAEARRRQVEYIAGQLQEWGLYNHRVLVHLWLAYCNYIALLYQDTKSEELVDEALASFKRLYLEALKALGEDCSLEKDFGEMLTEFGGQRDQAPRPARIVALKAPFKTQATPPKHGGSES
jgi:AcrR family transcriptional regulator